MKTYIGEFIKHVSNGYRITLQPDNKPFVIRFDEIVYYEVWMEYIWFVVNHNSEVSNIVMSRNEKYPIQVEREYLRKMCPNIVAPDTNFDLYEIIHRNMDV